VGTGGGEGGTPPAPLSFGEFASSSAAQQRRIEEQLLQEQQEKLRQQQLHRASMATEESEGTYYTEEEGTTSDGMSQQNSRNNSRTYSGAVAVSGLRGSTSSCNNASTGSGSGGSDQALLGAEAVAKSGGTPSRTRVNTTDSERHYSTGSVIKGSPDRHYNPQPPPPMSPGPSEHELSFNQQRMSSVARDTRDQAYFLGCSGVDDEDDAQRGACSRLARGFMRCCCCPVTLTMPEVRSAFVMWALCVVTCLFVRHWLYLASTVGTVSTTMLVFVFPSMLYFRLGLQSDFQAQPLGGCLGLDVVNILPNRLWMGLTQVVGMGLLVLNIGTVVCLLLTDADVVENQS
jgi:hypothetical protein